jgi:hypothetical protein
MSTLRSERSRGGEGYEVLAMMRSTQMNLVLVGEEVEVLKTLPMRPRMRELSDYPTPGVVGKGY